MDHSRSNESSERQEDVDVDLMSVGETFRRERTNQNNNSDTKRAGASY